MSRTLVMGQDRRELDPMGGFRSHADFLLAVHRAHTIGFIDERLKPRLVAADGDDPTGAFILPSSISNSIVLHTPIEVDPTAGRMLPVPMNTPEVQVAARVDKDHQTSVSGGLVVRRQSPDMPLDASRMKFEQIDLNSHEAIGLSYASERVVTDSPQSFAAVLGAAYRDEFHSVFLEERLRGTGVGECLGILNSPALITVAKETGQAPGTIVAENVVKMRARCWGYPRAVWMVQPDLMPQILTLSLPVGDGGAPIPLWRPGENGWPDTLCGRPLYTVEHCSEVGAVGDIIVCDWSQYLDATYVPFKSDESMHVRYQAMERAFRFYIRNDGQPWWRASLRPRRSSTTLSPYVTLAARA